jgi:hypothetical protein
MLRQLVWRLAVVQRKVHVPRRHLGEWQKRYAHLSFCAEAEYAPAQVVFGESQLFLHRQQSRALFPTRLGANALWYSS